MRANFSNGREGEIKVMPDRASEIAIERLRSLNFSIILKEVGDDKNKSEFRAVYEVEADKEGRVFWIFKTKFKLKAQIDSETGDVIKFDGPWWAFLVYGEEESNVDDKVTICHLPSGNVSKGRTITVGAPAVRAHLRHGDFIGACESDDDEGNETIGNETIGNETIANLTLEIFSPQNITYNVTDILVEISSNGDFISFSINNGTEESYNGSITKTFLEGNNTLSAFANNTNSSLTKEVVFSVVLPENITLPGNETGTGNESNSSA